MQRVEIAPGLTFSRLVYGMWRLGDDPDTSEAHVRAKVEACLDQGITTMDQADIYGGYRAEEILGRALKGTDLAQQIEIVSKCAIVAPMGRHSAVPVKHYDTSRRHIESSLEQSLRLLGVERVDLLLIHRPDPLMDHHETGAALDDLVSSGKARAVGVSNFRPWDWELLQSAMQNPLVTNQIEISLSRFEPFSNGDVAFHQRQRHPVMAWSPLGGGSLIAGSQPALADTLREVASASGVDDPSAVAVAWLLAHPACLLPVLGTNNLERIRQISQALAVEIDRPTWYRLYTAALGHEVP